MTSEGTGVAVVRAASDAVVGMDRAGRLTEFSPAAASMFGRSREEVLGRPLADVIVSRDLRCALHEELGRQLRMARGRAVVARVELYARRRGGARFPIELAVACVDGTPTLTGFIHDLSEQRRSEQEATSIQRLHEEESRRSQEANRLKSAFLATMSHELRTPLNAIVGFAELMRRGKVGPVSAVHKECLGDILASSRQLLELINGVLDLAKVEAGKMEFRREKVDLAKLIADVSHAHRGFAASKRIRVQTMVDPAVATVIVDPSKLKQVVDNYLSNALKFTPEEGVVILRAVPEGAARVRLEVEDSGIGIRPEDIGRLFVEFQQLDAGRAKRFAGTGLGLALAKRIVEAQGGRVGVTSVLGKGSTFWASLPRAADGEVHAFGSFPPAPPLTSAASPVDLATPAVVVLG